MGPLTLVMMIYLLLVAVFTAVVTAHPTSDRSDRSDTTDTGLPTVPELIIEKYLGKWYQAYGNRNNWRRGTPFATCTTGQYAANNDTTLRAINANRQITPDGELVYLRGHIYFTDEPGKLQIQFIDFNRRGDYWIIKLGPQGADGMYEYSVVTGSRFNDDSTLSILTRDVQRFKALYEEEALDFLRETGFTSYQTEPIETYHGDDCLYVDIDDPNIP